jgi:hypothetical protein
LRKAPLGVALFLTQLCLGSGGLRAEPWDVAPRDNDGASPPLYCPVGNSRVEPEDALVTLRRAVNLVTGFECFDEEIGDHIVDVAPAVIDHSTNPPTVSAIGEGRVSPEDALLILRASVGLIDLVPPKVNPALAQVLDTVPSPPSLGDLNANSPTFPETGDVDCDADGEFDPVEDTVLRVAVETGFPASRPYDICIWFDRSVENLDFDVPPAGFGPEDHDGNRDGRLTPNPDPDVCATVCPEGSPGPECAFTEFAGDSGSIIHVGPFHPVGPPDDLNFQEWAIVVDPNFVLPDETFADNLRTKDVIVRQCPPLAPDLVVDEFFGVQSVPQSPGSDDDINLQARIANQGELPVSTTFQVDVYVDPGPFPFGVPVPGFDRPQPEGDSFRTIAASPQFPLQPGQSLTLQFNDFDPEESGKQPLRLDPGLHRVVVLADSAGVFGFGVGAVEESDEQNNIFPSGINQHAARICVGTERGFGSPDLAITKARFLQRGSDSLACNRRAGDLVDLEITVANLDEREDARDLDISPGGRVDNAYQILAAGTGLDGFLFDCVPVGQQPVPLRAFVVDPLVDDAIVLEVKRGSATAPFDVDPDNNLVEVPLLNQPPIVDAGPAISEVRAGVPEPMAPNVSDPNDVPPGSMPIGTYTWTVVSQPEDSEAEFDDAALEAPEFTADMAGAYTLRLTVTDCPGGFSVSDTVVVTVGENEAPSARAGDDFSVDAEEEDVKLDGSKSSDPDAGDELSFEWTQTAGEPVGIQDADKAIATFDAPAAPAEGAGILTFQLEVTDLAGNTDTDEVQVTVAPSGDPL